MQMDENTAKNTIFEMLLEYTGMVAADSGAAYGRHFEINSKKTLSDFENEPFITISNKPFPDYIVSLFHYLNKYLELDDVCKTFNSFEYVEDKYDTSFGLYGINKDQVNYLEINRTSVDSTFNTYNVDTDLSQGFIGTYLTINNSEYILIRIHGGCDYQWGYTDAKLFKFKDQTRPYIERLPIFGKIKWNDQILNVSNENSDFLTIDDSNNPIPNNCEILSLSVAEF